MKNIILAAGYATRLYPITENFPKPLLDIGGRSILDRLLADIDSIEEVDQHIVVVNHKFVDFFLRWKDSSSYRKSISIVDDGSVDNDHRLGAVKDLLLAMETNSVDDDMLVVAADNILDFSFSGFVDFFKQKGTSLIMCHHEPSLKALQKTGVVTLDESNKVLLMEEKPADPKSNWAVPPFYIYKKSDLDWVRNCISNGCKFDAPGNLAHYLCQHTPIHAWPMAGHRVDIGDVASYEKAKKEITY